MDNKTVDPSQQISDELINAFIDHQITKEERLEILSMIKHDKNLASRICDMKSLKEMTQHAFDDIPASSHVAPRKQPLLPRLAAAVSIFALGLIVGLASIQLNTPQQSLQQAALDAESEQALTKVLVHLTSSEVESGLNTLNNLQHLLEDYRNNQQPVLIEVIANGEGIKLLSADKLIIADRIAQLTRLYDNVSFSACKNTIDQMRLSKGLHIQLIPQVKLVDSGVVEVIQRQREGWTYIRG